MPRVTRPAPTRRAASAPRHDQNVSGVAFMAVGRPAGQQLLHHASGDHELACLFRSPRQIWNADVDDIHRSAPLRARLDQMSDFGKPEGGCGGSPDAGAAWLPGIGMQPGGDIDREYGPVRKIDELDHLFVITAHVGIQTGSENGVDPVVDVTHAMILGGECLFIWDFEDRHVQGRQQIQVGRRIAFHLRCRCH